MLKNKDNQEVNVTLKDKEEITKKDVALNLDVNKTVTHKLKPVESMFVCSFKLFFSTFFYSIIFLLSVFVIVFFSYFF